MKDRPEPSGIHELARECDRWNAAVIEPHERRNLTRRAVHRNRFVERQRERLLAQDDLSSLCGGNGGRGVQVVGQAMSTASTSPRSIAARQSVAVCSQAALPSADIGAGLSISSSACVD